MTVVSLRTTEGAVVCERCRIATTFPARLRGLLGRPGLPAGEGLWIRPAASVHTLFMRFSIDVVFLDRDGIVVAIAASVRPWRAASARRARSCVELTAGECERRGLRVGHRLEAGP